MKELPILFSTMMVQANLEDRKGMTRRIINPQPIWCVDKDGNMYEGNYTGYVKVDGHPNWPHQFAAEFCQIKKGDILYVREEHYRYGHWIEKEGEFTKTGKQKIMFIATTDEVRYYNDRPSEVIGRNRKDLSRSGWYKRLARFMPKIASRIWLHVTDVKVERLKDITDSDAIAEGIESYIRIADIIAYKNYSEFARKDFLNVSKYGFDNGKETQSAPVASFCTLWIEINGRESWISNPWVWVIKYKILSKTGRPETFPVSIPYP